MCPQFEEANRDPATEAELCTAAYLPTLKKRKITALTFPLNVELLSSYAMCCALYYATDQIFGSLKTFKIFQSDLAAFWPNFICLRWFSARIPVCFSKQRAHWPLSTVGNTLTMHKYLIQPHLKIPEISLGRKKSDGLIIHGKCITFTCFIGSKTQQ